MEYAQNVRVVNVSSKVSPRLKRGVNNANYPRLQPGESKIVNWGTAVLWLGDPNLTDRNYEMEETRVRAFYGCAIEDSDMPRHLPDFEVYDIESGDRVVTLCDLLLGKDVQLSRASEPEGDLKFVMGELVRLKAENERMARQMTLLAEGRSIRAAEPVTPADENEPVPMGVTSADAPVVARASRSKGTANG